MENLLWLLNIYPDYRSKAIVVMEKLFCRKAYFHRLAMEQRLYFEITRSWSR